MPFPVILPTVLAFALVCFVAYYVWSGAQRLRRAQFIRTYVLPKGLFEKLREKRPSLELKDCSLVARGLRQFFLAHLNSGNGFVSMPSQITDDLWHEFILYTREYQSFCSKAFGEFLHHSPAVVLGSIERSNEGLRTVWVQACREENINPRNPTRLPLLFALDEKLHIENGFRYVPDCGSLVGAGKVVHCGAALVPARALRSGRSNGGGCAGGCGGGGCGGD